MCQGDPQEPMLKPQRAPDARWGSPRPEQVLEVDHALVEVVSDHPTAHGGLHPLSTQFLEEESPIAGDQ